MAENTPSTIRGAAELCSNLFCEALDLLAESEAPKAWTRLRDQFGRFKIWSSNLGVFADLHASLDYRLRNLPDARDIAIENLDVMNRRLEQVQPALLKHGSQKSQGDEASNTASHPFGETAGENEIEETIQAISNSLRWLLRLYNSIRIASKDKQNLKSMSAPMPDMEREAREKLYRAWIRRDFPGVSDVLAARLVSTMLLRYGQVLYRRSRQEELKLRESATHKREPIHLQPMAGSFVEEGKKSGLSRPTQPAERGRVVPSEFTATTIDPGKYRRPSAPSRISKAQTISLNRINQLTAPHPPNIGDADEFICPYCCLVRPATEALDKVKWSEHVKKDSAPYLCLFEACDQADHIMGSSTEWMMHMRETHLMRWRCNAKTHDTCIFEQQSDFEGHMKAEHHGQFKEEQLQFIAKTSARPVAQIFENCPFGCEETDNLESHVAQHLHHLALLSLPLPDDHDDGSYVSGPSSVTNDSAEFQYTHKQGPPSHVSSAEFDDIPDQDGKRPVDDSIPDYLFSSSSQSATTNGSLYQSWGYVLNVGRYYGPSSKSEDLEDPIQQQFIQAQALHQTHELDHISTERQPSQPHSPSRALVSVGEGPSTPRPLELASFSKSEEVEHLRPAESKVSRSVVSPRTQDDLAKQAREMPRILTSGTPFEIYCLPDESMVRFKAMVIQDLEANIITKAAYSKLGKGPIVHAYDHTIIRCEERSFEVRDLVSFRFSWDGSARSVKEIFYVAEVGEGGFPHQCDVLFSYRPRYQ